MDANLDMEQECSDADGVRIRGLEGRMGGETSLRAERRSSKVRNWGELDRRGTASHEEWSSDARGKAGHGAGAGRTVTSGVCCDAVIGDGGRIAVSRSGNTDTAKEHGPAERAIISDLDVSSRVTVRPKAPSGRAAGRRRAVSESESIDVHRASWSVRAVRPQRYRL